MNDIPEVALRTIEDTFGTRFVRHADGEAEPDAGQLFASVFPENASEVESLTKLAARHRIPLIARGAGTALNPGRDRPLRPAVRSYGARGLPQRSRSSSASLAIQGTVSRWGEVALLAFDPAKGSADLVDLSATTDIELVRLAGRSWMAERR
ncbi:MAG TPA: hypothetical protein VNT12_07540 [Rubrobacter sp.]|jgi:hypothetical protein|nr:hypothetical protein [Rubrobacter sp.]